MYYSAVNNAVTEFCLFKSEFILPFTLKACTS